MDIVSQNEVLPVVFCLLNVRSASNQSQGNHINLLAIEGFKISFMPNGKR